jgi:hypothetical protein
VAVKNTCALGIPSSSSNRRVTASHSASGTPPVSTVTSAAVALSFPMTMALA